ncbi:PQQ-binding-like beta-propeller repeat protein [Streptomyces sp. NPDC029721]|uniref:outer membrane protein assembly factor BamB family protein n=1 Tax=Streptomyces sp. NPDC029721 TaxID=3157090 RepID=UPI0033F30A4C
MWTVPGPGAAKVTSRSSRRAGRRARKMVPVSTYVRWERPLHQRGDPRTVAVDGDCVVVHERLSRLVCLDPEDGSVRWDRPFGRWPRAVVAAGGRCYGIAQDVDALSCRDLRSGEELWSAPLPGYTGHVGFLSGRGAVLRRCPSARAAVFRAHTGCRPGRCRPGRPDPGRRPGRLRPGAGPRRAAVGSRRRRVRER